MTKDELIRHLALDTRVLENLRLREAFTNIDRAEFVPLDYRDEAYEDYALPIGFGQTISQPTTVAFMLELLDVRPGDRVLDVGSGSGYTTALLSHLAGTQGEVLGVETVPELVVIGRRNIERTEKNNARIVPAGAGIGFPSAGPFDRILVSAAGRDVPPALLAQLKTPGILVMPVGDSIVQIIRSEKGVERREFPGFVFVPLV